MSAPGLTPGDDAADMVALMLESGVVLGMSGPAVIGARRRSVERFTAETVGQLLAAELVSLDRGPASFPWPHYSTKFHDEGREFTTYGTAPVDVPMSVLVGHEHADEVAQVLEREWAAHLDATRTPEEIRAFIDRQGISMSLFVDPARFAAAVGADDVTDLLERADVTSTGELVGRIAHENLDELVATLGDGLTVDELVARLTGRGVR